MGTAYVRVADYKEFDNGHVIHGGWSKISRAKAEDLAKEASIKDPENIYYVAYDDIMNPSSDLRWVNGKSYHYSKVKMQGDKPLIKESIEYKYRYHFIIIDFQDYYRDIDGYLNAESLEDAKQKLKDIISKYKKQKYLVRDIQVYEIPIKKENKNG